MLKAIDRIVNSPLADLKECTKPRADAYGILIKHQIKFIGATGLVYLLILAALYKKEQMNNKHEETMAEIELEKMKLISENERGEEDESN